MYIYPHIALRQIPGGRKKGCRRTGVRGHGLVLNSGLRTQTTCNWDARPLTVNDYDFSARSQISKPFPINRRRHWFPFELAHWATHPWNPRLDMHISYNPKPQLHLKLFKSQVSSSYDHLFSELISTCRPL